MRVATMRRIVDDPRPTIFEATISRFARRNSGALTDLAIFNPLFPSCEHAAQNIHRPRRASVARNPARDRGEITDFFPIFTEERDLEETLSSILNRFIN